MTQIWQIVLPLIVLQLLLMVTALITCVKEANTRGPKWLWICLILFVGIFGPIAFFVFGRNPYGKAPHDSE